MAEAIVSIVVDKLCDPLLKEALFLSGVDERMESIKDELERIRCFLKDADSRRKRDERVKHWVKEIREVSYEIEDTIDSFLVEMDGTCRKGESLLNYLKRLAVKTTVLPARHKLGCEIDRIQKKISKISESRLTYQISDLGDVEFGLSVHKRPFHPDIDDAEVIGLHVDKKNIVDKLVDRITERRRVISIVGPGGLGKTTLARKVYNSQEVKQRFYYRIWLTISQEFRLIDILKKVIEKIRYVRKEEEEKGVEHLIGELNKIMRDKRYLIVMDDVWDERLWSQIEEALPDVKNGSRVLITTRLYNVGRRADASSQPYELQFLTEKDSLELLLKKAFPNQTDFMLCCPSELLGLAEQLAKRCGGLPLALVVLGGLLSIKPLTYASWNKVLQTMDWNVDGSECMSILATSYKDLPHFLKSCFMYLASFPEDYEFKARPLIKMWIAEGFIPYKERGTFEDTAESFLEELVQRCLVQVTKRNFHAAIKSCRVHDLIRELAINEAKENDFLRVYKKESREKDANFIRRAAFHSGCGITERLLHSSMSRVRSLLIFTDFNYTRGNFTSLRVLEITANVQIEYFPEELTRMIHLRYLGLRSYILKEIPKTIGRLQNLLTLDIRRTKIRCLPESFWSIKSLRHVHFFPDSELDGPPRSANLENLQSLGFICLPKTWVKGLPCLTGLRKFEVQIHDRLRWKLLSSLLATLEHLISVWIWIKGMNIRAEILDSIMNSPSYHTIQSLHLKACPPLVISLHSVEFPPNLTKLKLEGLDFEEDPMPKLEKLRCLRFLNLKSVKIELIRYTPFFKKMKGKMVCLSGGFPRVQILRLENVLGLEEWSVERGAMQMLSQLFIDQCRELQMMPELQYNTSLKELYINHMPKEFMRRINHTGADWYKIQHVPLVEYPK